MVPHHRIRALLYLNLHAQPVEATAAPAAATTAATQPQQQQQQYAAGSSDLQAQVLGFLHPCLNCTTPLRTMPKCQFHDYLPEPGHYQLDLLENSQSFIVLYKLAKLHFIV